MSIGMDKKITMKAIIYIFIIIIFFSFSFIETSWAGKLYFYIFQKLET